MKTDIEIYKEEAFVYRQMLNFINQNKPENTKEIITDKFGGKFIFPNNSIIELTPHFLNGKSVSSQIKFVEDRDKIVSFVLRFFNNNQDISVLRNFVSKFIVDYEAEQNRKFGIELEQKLFKNNG